MLKKNILYVHYFFYEMYETDFPILLIFSKGCFLLYINLTFSKHREKIIITVDCLSK